MVLAAHKSEEGTCPTFEAESSAIKQKILQNIAEQDAEHFIKFVTCTFMQAEELVLQVSSFTPSILHLSCFQKGNYVCSKCEDVFQAFCDRNKRALTQDRVRLIISNIALLDESTTLFDNVDHVIFFRKRDQCPSKEAMTTFNQKLFFWLGENSSLETSFNLASKACDCYIITGKSPGNFYLPHRDIMLRKGPLYSMFTFLVGANLASIAQAAAIELAKKGYEGSHQLYHLAPQIINELVSFQSHHKAILLGYIADQCSDASTDSDSDSDFESSSQTSPSKYNSRWSTEEQYTQQGSKLRKGSMVIRNTGNAEDFWVHIKSFITKMYQTLEEKCSWNILLIAGTLRHIYDIQPPDRPQQKVIQDELLKRTWMSLIDSDCCNDLSMLELLDKVIMKEEVGSNFRKEAQARFPGLPFSATVLAIDSLVRSCNIQQRNVWDNKVFFQWLRNHETAEEFLQHTNKFLRECFASAEVLGDTIATKSYAAFLLMDLLSMTLLQLYVEWCKVLPRNAVGPEPLGGFVFFMSSTGTYVVTTWNHLPSKESRAVIFEGLLVIANMPRDSLKESYGLQPLLREQMLDEIQVLKEMKVVSWNFVKKTSNLYKTKYKNKCIFHTICAPSMT